MADAITRCKPIWRFITRSPVTPATSRLNLALNKRSYQLADFKNESTAEPTMIRREFKDTAFWQADVVTGGDGKATVQFKLPDNLTTWRATARAVTADTRVGSAVQKVLSRKDVIMRLEMPRFLTEGDTVTISGVVHNFLKQGKEHTHLSGVEWRATFRRAGSDCDHPTRWTIPG